MKNIILEKINNLQEDVYFFEDGNVINITINDFDGYYEDGEEKPRNFLNPKGVEELITYLTYNSKSTEPDFYTRYIFEEFEVALGYASYDI